MLPRESGGLNFQYPGLIQPSQIAKMRERMIKDEQARKEMENTQTTLIQEKNQLFTQLQRVSLWG